MNEKVNFAFQKSTKEAKIEASSREKESNSSFVISTNATNAPFASGYQGSNNPKFTKESHTIRKYKSMLPSHIKFSLLL
jgi:hypothetical protein